jgi:hypothetical protein
MPVHRLIVLLASLAALSSAPSLASAQVGGPRMHIGAGFVLDVGGEIDFDTTPDYDLDATVGLRGHLDYAVHRYVSVGGLVRMSWWEPDDEAFGIDRSFLLDLGPRVIGHYDWREFRFYGGISPGLTLSAIDHYTNDVDNPAAGFTLSLTVAGAEWWFSRRAGLFLELGWVGHWFEHDFDGVGVADLEIELSQAMMEFGFVFGV